MDQESRRLYKIIVSCNLGALLLGGGTLYLLSERLELAYLLLGMVALNAFLMAFKPRQRKPMENLESSEEDEDGFLNFIEVVQLFVNDERYKPIDRKLILDLRLQPHVTTLISDDDELKEIASREDQFQAAAARRDRAAMAIDLLAVRVNEEQARTQNRHATWMKWLTVAITVATIAQVVIAFVNGN